jgi:hypothetical protein
MARILLQKWEEALATIREEIASPFLRTASYQADLRTVGIGALADYSRMRGLTPEADAEARRRALAHLFRGSSFALT